MDYKYKVSEPVAFRDGRRTLRGIIDAIVDLSDKHAGLFWYDVTVGKDSKHYTVGEDKIIAPDRERHKQSVAIDFRRGDKNGE